VELWPALGFEDTEFGVFIESGASRSDMCGQGELGHSAKSRHPKDDISTCHHMVFLKIPHIIPTELPSDI